ncbi:DNA polymerase ligase N-terminal domain-containing protein [Salinactinospora qingdaonensis]|uniref:DNA polymerase ligase N-terminal domain-containing protein n=1 Tax=Salinactinospora qingdaonensis TaxID=702744 RepID=A0ABP7FM59_9ACTN
MATTDDSHERQHPRTVDSVSQPSQAQPGTAGERPQFVIQRHAASTDHYDFRLEVEGTLKSWSVPKGPSIDPAQKRLALPTEDHALDYADFEGTIPNGDYGAGTVLIWDRGTYTNTTVEQGHEVSMSHGLHQGHVSFRLHGDKLDGGYALNRIRRGSDEAWLLVKERDEAADAGDEPTTRPESVRTGRDIDEVARDDEAEQQ